MTVADRTEQWNKALKLANTIRVANAAWKQELHGMPAPRACQFLADALLDEAVMAGPAGSIQVAQALLSVRRLGEIKARRMLMAAGIINAQKALRDLTARQREELAWELTTRTPMDTKWHV